MPNVNTSEQTLESNPSSAVHKPFSWLRDDVKNHPMADFVALTMDVCDGIKTCLEIIHVSNLERSSNAELDPQDAELPAVNAHDATNLLRFTIASAKLLRGVANEKIDMINAYGMAELQNMKVRAK